MAGVFTEALQPERSARRAQRRARREQRKTLVLALVQRLLQLDAAEQGECGSTRQANSLLAILRAALLDFLTVSVYSQPSFAAYQLGTSSTYARMVVTYCQHALRDV